MTEITLPEVAALQQRARFFTNDKGRNKVEISAVGSKDTVISDVTPTIMARFKPEWDAFCDGRPLARRPGTALTEVSGINQDKADSYVARNVHTAEELAALTDAQCQGVGHGTLTDRKAAIQLVAERRMKADLAQRDRVGSAAANLKSPQVTEPNADIAELKAQVGELTKAVAALVEMQARKKPGPKPKD